MKKVKRRLLTAVVLGCILSLTTLTEADATVRTGKITFYDGVGKTGGDGKVLTKWDCAVGNLYKYTIAKGTAIYTSNIAQSKFVTLYKWDWGAFQDPVILDVQRETYKNDLGGVIDSDGGGWISNGRISY